MIRRMDDDDLKWVLQAEQELFSHPWPNDQFLYELHENPFAQVFVLEDNGERIAYADLWILYDQAQIANIGVLKRFQRNGYGEALLDHCIAYADENHCDNLSLEVRIDNKPAVSLYEKKGFIQAAVRKNYYEDGTDAYLMIKPLGGNVL